MRGWSGSSLKATAALLLSGSLLTGAAGLALAQAQTVNVTLRNFAIEGAPASVRAGQQLRFNVTNPGPTGQHNLSIDTGSAVVASPDPNVAPMMNGVITITAPSTPGTYRLFCPVGQHRANGMDVSLTVVAGAAALPTTGGFGVPAGLAAAGLAAGVAGIALRRRRA
jgi:LPXTG-motif cell wall-anchored protein